MEPSYKPILIESQDMAAHSAQHPQEIFTDELGHIAWNGQVFDNERHFLVYMRMLKSPPVQWYLKTTHKIKQFFSRKK